jgi:LPXTG-site transpeptidase (sortase) family protein
MKQKIKLKWIVLTLGIVVIIFSFVFFHFLIRDTPEVVDPILPVISEQLQKLIAQSAMATSSQVRSGLPIRLTIPKIHVDTTFVSVGLTPTGAMDIPKGPNDVGWFNLGPRPGEIGSAVVAGHFGWKNNIPAVFDDLHTLKRGDKIYVQDDKGAKTTFVVTEVGIYDQNGDAANVFGSNDGKAHLNLITCQGVWNVGQKSYSQRFVVFTDKEEI